MKIIDCNLQNKKKYNKDDKSSSTSLEKRKLDSQDDELDYSGKSPLKKSNNKKGYSSSSYKDDDFYSKSERRISARLKNQPQPSYEDNSMDEDYESDESFNSSLFYEEESKIAESGSTMNEDIIDNPDEASSSEFIPDTDSNSYTSKKGNKTNDKKFSSKQPSKNKNTLSQSENNGNFFFFF